MTHKDFQRERGLANQQFELQEQMAQNAFARNMAATKDEREYNTPTNQLQRLKDAGLNPLYYGLDGNSSNGAPFQTNTPQAPDMGSIAQAIQAKQANVIASIQQVLQASKNMAEVQYMNSQTALNYARVPNINADTNLKQVESTWRPMRYGSELKVNDSKVALNESAKNVNNQQKQNLEQNFKNLIQELNESQSREELNRQNTATSAAQEAVSLANENLIKAQTETEKSQNKKVQQETANLRTQNEIAYEDLYSKRVQNGALPELLNQKFQINKGNIELTNAHKENFNALTEFLNAGTNARKLQMYVDGVKVGLFRTENGEIKVDFDKPYNYFQNMRAINVIRGYLDIGNTLGVMYSRHVNDALNVLKTVTPLGLFSPTNIQSPMLPSSSTPAFTPYLLE